MLHAEMRDHRRICHCALPSATQKGRNAGVFDVGAGLALLGRCWSPVWDGLKPTVLGSQAADTFGGHRIAMSLFFYGRRVARQLAAGAYPAVGRA